MTSLDSGILQESVFPVSSDCNFCEFFVLFSLLPTRVTWLGEKEWLFLLGLESGSGRPQLTGFYGEQAGILSSLEAGFGRNCCDQEVRLGQ